jgi:hypothetical protein
MSPVDAYSARSKAAGCLRTGSPSIVSRPRALALGPIRLTALLSQGSVV